MERQAGTEEVRFYDPPSRQFPKVQLFRKESDILVEVLLTLKRQSVVALPIHDAVLVADEDKDTAVRVMKEVFNKHTGITPEVTS